MVGRNLPKSIIRTVYSLHAYLHTHTYIMASEPKCMCVVRSINCNRSNEFEITESQRNDGTEKHEESRYACVKYTKYEHRAHKKNRINEFSVESRKTQRIHVRPYTYTNIHNI